MVMIGESHFLYHSYECFSGDRDAGFQVEQREIRIGCKVYVPAHHVSHESTDKTRVSGLQVRFDNTRMHTVSRYAFAAKTLV